MGDDGVVYCAVPDDRCVDPDTAVLHAGAAEVAIADISCGPATSTAATTAGGGSGCARNEASGERPALERRAANARQDSPEGGDDQGGRGAAAAYDGRRGGRRSWRDSRRAARRSDWRNRKRYFEPGDHAQAAAGRGTAAAEDLARGDEWTADPQS